MKLKRIEINNFLSIKEASIDLDNRGIVLIDGVNNTPATTIDTNGTGKSSMLSSIFYAIYGELPNGEKADSLINRNFGKNMSVKLYFEVNETSYTITRTRKKNSLIFESNGIDVTKGTMKETQQDIDSIISIRKDVYLSTIYFDGHNSIPFSMLTDKQRKDYLEILFDVGVYKEAYDKTKEDIKENKSKIESFNSKKEATQRLLDNEKDVVKQIEGIKKEYQQKVPLLKKEADDLSSYLSEKEVVYKRKIEELSESEIKIKSSLNSTMDNVEYKELREEVARLESGYNTLFNNQTKHKSVIDEKAKLIKELSSSEICYVCGNKIDEAHKQKETEKIMSELKPIVAEYKLRKPDLDKLEDAIKIKKEELYSLQESVDRESENKSRLYEELSNITILINKEKSEFSNYQSKEKQAIKNYEDYIKESGKYDGVIEEHIQKEAKLSEELKDIENQTETLLDLDVKLNKALFSFSDKGIKSHVLDLVTPELNTRVANYLTFLTGGTISVTFSTQTEKASGELIDKFDIKVINNGSDTSYESLSSGEKRRVDIAISLTLQDILMAKSTTNTNILVYDELFESLDAVGAESVVELLKQRLDTVGTIFVVTHNENLKPLFSETITAIKEKDGNTHIENGEINK